MSTSISENLKQARINAGYSSVKQFVETFHLPMATYYQHESGKRKPKLDTVRYYCQLLEISIETLLSDSGVSNLSRITTEDKKPYNPIFEKKTTVMREMLHSPYDASDLSFSEKNLLSLDRLVDLVSASLNKHKSFLKKQEMLIVCNIIQTLMKKHRVVSFDTKLDFINAIINIVAIVLK